MRIIQAGYDVVYDNDNYVWHYASPRPATDDRESIYGPTVVARIYNSALVTAKFRPWSEVFFSILLTFLVGSRFQPGIVWSWLLVPKHGWKVLLFPWQQLEPLWRGTQRGVQLRKGTVTHRHGPWSWKKTPHVTDPASVASNNSKVLR